MVAKKGGRRQGEPLKGNFSRDEKDVRSPLWNLRVVGEE